MGKYEDFLGKKTQLGSYDGFDGKFWPDGMFDFQKSLVEWALFKGRGALFADTGLGKTLMQLTWADNIVRHENKPVLILTPLAVGSQTVREGKNSGLSVQSRKPERLGRASTSPIMKNSTYSIHMTLPGRFATNGPY